MYAPSVFQTYSATVRILISPQNLFSLKLTHVQACDKHPSCSASTKPLQSHTYFCVNQNKVRAPLQKHILEFVSS